MLVFSVSCKQHAAQEYFTEEMYSIDIRLERIMVDILHIVDQGVSQCHTHIWVGPYKVIWYRWTDATPALMDDDTWIGWHWELDDQGAWTTWYTYGQKTTDGM